ncbi:CRISPR-associated protein, Csh1 family [Methanosarcina lacustris Z-7289]|uniref:CRISPR-associated protein, Csh1 family n=1 Tax=Methanosarcina lacustris Z-7289 TaxID=1434111 RepID=A0A0E3S8G5_9EURY|nr:TIGR02556 family CRISPR-associated protein [Methanosarcina lacustris]AKB75792.1 CRISPR-associated protein, Csh1 family [Methanosarcina lacustris Z-7289]
MLDYIRSIGQVVKNSEGESDRVGLFQKMDSETSESCDGIIDVNINDTADAHGNYVSVSATRAFTREVSKEGLFYVKSRTYIGAMLRQNQYQSDKNKEANKEAKKNEDVGVEPAKKRKREPKPSSNVSKCLQFLDLSMDRLDEVNSKLDAKIAEKVAENPKYNYVILFTRNGKKPFEIDSCRKKFIELYKRNILHATDTPGYCHLCNRLVNSRFESCGLGCYTNDKSVYYKTYGSEADRSLPFGVCDDCLADLLYGERFALQYLTVWWGGLKGEKVIFLPHQFNDDIKLTFETNLIGDTESNKGFLARIQTNEADVLGCIGTGDYAMDVIFISAPAGRSEWKIQCVIENVSTSRFAKIAKLQKIYQTRGGETSDGREIKIRNLQLKTIIYYLVGNFAEKKGFPAYEDIFATNEARYYLDVILHGVEINRREFFVHVMSIFWRYYARDKERECIMTIHRIYNFLVDCGCLQHGWNMPLYIGGENMVAPYLTIDELFERNPERFSSDFRKAWFLLGNVYGSIRRDMKSARSDRGGDYATKLVENAFITDRKFNMKDFNEIARVCWEYSCAHNTEHYIKTRLANAIDLIGTGSDVEGISPDEIALYFVWGQTQYIGKEKENEDTGDADENPDNNTTDEENSDKNDE